jgi:signal transduction histidine kinase
MATVDPYKTELHASGFRAMLEIATQELGQPAVSGLVRELGVTLEELADPNGWFSLEFAEALIGAIDVRIKDPTWFDRAMRLGVTAKYLGMLYPLFRAFGTPAFTYKQTVSIVQRLNKTMSWKLEALEDNFARFRVTPAPGITRERSIYMCRVRLVQAEALSTLFDLPPARVEHPECLHRGDDCCVYEVHWKEHRRPLRSLAWLVLAACAGMSVAAHFDLPLAWAIALTAISGLGGWALGRVNELKRDIRARMIDLNDSHDALTRSSFTNEQRVAELLQAKTEVENKVELRTSELRQATQRLSETLGEIQALDRAKTDFFNNVSHELRSPLTLILAPLEELVHGRTPAGGDRAAFEAMHRSAVRLLRLINQLLDLAKIDAGEMKIAPLPTDLIALVRSTMAPFQVASQKKGVPLELVAPPSMPSVVLDSAWIESAISNLLANALRLTKSPGAVRLRIEDHGSEISVAVSDDGPGIAPEDQKKVFERFAQGDSTKRVVGGTGIGLALVREAARLHGGDVRLASELGRGATFTLNLPRRPEQHGDVRPIDAAKPSQLPARLVLDEFSEERESAERTGPSANAPLALVVEDNPELREFIANVLSVRYRVRAASDGKKGLAAALDLRPDVIVSDIAMPDMDGLQLCRTLRARGETRATPILLVTARTEISSVLEGFEAGASDYINKPFHGRELLARVDVHVRLRRMMQEFAVRERHATLGVLAASVAHQVRNPLTSLVSGLPAMRAKLGDSVGESTQQLMDIMIDCAGRIERLTVDLTDLSRVDREVGGPYRPSDGLRAAIRLVHARLPTTLRVEEQITDAPVIEGRPGDMNHVFLNLLDNAARAAGDEGRIRIEAATHDGAYLIRIGDSGPGVEDSIAKQIFEPFFTTRPAGEGTGLGLAVAQQVVMQCGGEITLGRSELGGAQFSVRIPLGLTPSLQPAAQPTLH